MNEQFFDSDSFTPRARELVKMPSLWQEAGGILISALSISCSLPPMRRTPQPVQCFCATRSRLKG